MVHADSYITWKLNERRNNDRNNWNKKNISNNNDNIKY